ncbi:tyrosine-protein phosphatase [Paenibacillus sp. GP183]|uniref:tyrosine-protein phosphatase n=1 Tax=Paenibacillus sp. GP183 TaxID=1882751 RepID=UPI0008998497|nr:tyrosine-protein phosphatase [Paenibacillus sp. GP183]SEB86336.1 protein-tyrosine phosphatase [Paenibacillus sp. GP183]
MYKHSANEQRVLQIEGAYNVRDLGGYLTKDGRTTRWGVLFRADGLHKLTEESHGALVNKGVRTVIDLRHTRELEEKKNVFADSDKVNYHNVSLINPSAVGNAQIHSLGDLYINILEGSKAELLQVFSLLADRTDQATLFHCAAGKDKTGIVAALLLDLAGVPHETIREDYALTASCIAPIMEELRSDRPSSVPEEIYENFLGSDPINMMDMLNHIESQYGDSEGYLLSIGMSDEQVQALKAQLLKVEY